MPYFIGAHPAFNCPLVEGEKYEDYSLEFSEVESCSIPKSFPETGLLDLQDRTPFLENQSLLIWITHFFLMTPLHLTD